jgi:hypothetical protein
MKKLNFFSPKNSVQTMRCAMFCSLNSSGLPFNFTASAPMVVRSLTALTHIFGTPSNPRSTKRSNNPLSRANDGLQQLDEGPLDGLQIDWLTSEAAAHWSTESYARVQENCMCDASGQEASFLSSQPHIACAPAPGQAFRQWRPRQTP